MTSSRILVLLSSVAVLGLAAAAPACSSSDSTTTTTPPDGGTTQPDATIPPTGDAGCTAVPATGLTQIVPPAADTSESDTGRAVAMTLDAHGNPVVAYLDGTSHARVLMTMRWDPCTGAWTTPVQLDALATVDDKGAVSIATDATDGRIAITYAKQVMIAQPNATLATYIVFSTDGAKTFSAPKKISTHLVDTNAASGDANDVDSPVVALAKGKTFVAYNQDEIACATGGTGCQEGTVLLTSADGVTFTQEVLSDGVVGAVSGHLVARGLFHIGLATDASGAPAVVTHQSPQTGYTTGVMFCRSGATCVKILDSNGVQNDDGASTLIFTGTKANVITTLQRGGTAYDLLYTSSNDGTVWAAPTALPRDGDARTTALVRESLVANGTTGVIVLASASADGTYGTPKIFTSGTTWSISGATPADTKQPYADYPTGRVAANGKLMLTFQGSYPSTSSGTGVTFWSQP